LQAFFSETNPDIFRTVTDNLVEDCLNNYKLGYVVDVDASGVTYAATSENVSFGQFAFRLQSIYAL